MKIFLLREKPSSNLLLAAWFGLFFGYAEVILLSIRKYILARVIFQSHHYVWMIPLMDLVVFSAIGVTLLVLALKWNQFASWQWTIPVFAFPGFMALYFVKPKISIFAALILAFGLSIQFTRIATTHKELFGKVVGITFPVMGTVLILTIVFMLRFYP